MPVTVSLSNSCCPKGASEGAPPSVVQLVNAIMAAAIEAIREIRLRDVFLIKRTLQRNPGIIRIMSSAKTERLVNLTMALLGSKRYMTKSEIFRRVAGYSGSNETKERMFERDKDDLRNLGIEIEVASHDPLFEDEVGYRIRPEVFQLREKFDAEELGLISLALNLVKESDFDSSNSSISRRLNSLAITPTMPEEFRIKDQNIGESGLAELISALAERRTIEFDYRKDDSARSETRKVNPLGLSAWRGSWYLVGEDLNRDDVRVFKISRIVSSISLLGSKNAYGIPSDFNIKDYLIMLRPGEYSATLKIRKAAGIHLRNLATEIRNLDEDWDLIEVHFQDADEALREVMWLGADVIVIEPHDLRTSVIQSLNNLVNRHG